MKTICIAHSPDADDIFMYYAIKFGWVGMSGVNFTNIALDIETLNVEALKGTYDVTAISFALYPHIKNEYALLKTAVSFGEGYGPKLVKLKETKLKKNFKVALSGEYTTNALLFKIAYPDARVVYKNFIDIEEAILNKEVDAGVLIHESILNFSDKLTLEREIWDVWKTLIKEDLPLPLGGMAIRRSMPILSAIECEQTLTKAVKIATSCKAQLSKMLLERNLVRVDNKTLEKYLNLYANSNSISISEIQLKAINKLYELGYKNGFYSETMSTEDYLIPDEYKEIRFS